MRLFLCFSFLILLSACTVGSPPTWLTPADQQLFVLGMDEFNAKDGMPDAFVILQQRYPDSPWSAKAHTLQTLLETIQKQQKTIKRLEGIQALNRKQNQELQQQIESLETDLETMGAERTKLRQLLIDLERRSR